ncbi:MAG: twin-arginine translocation signal domain-containing protein, partial [Chthonomonadales bacterium]
MQLDDKIIHLRQKSQEKPLSRRDFMQTLSLAAAAGPGLVAASLTGFSLTHSQRAEAAETTAVYLDKLPMVQYGTKMGKMKVARVCIAQDWPGALFAPALEMGMNFVHKAGYWGNNVPDEIKKLPRESYYTDITVDNTSPGHNPDNFDEAYNQVVQSLDKNGLKYYDVYRAHYGWTNVDKFKVENVSYKAFLRLKKEGKVKYFGVSQHPYVPYPEIIQAQIDSGIIDSMQVWF